MRSITRFTNKNEKMPGCCIFALHETQLPGSGAAGGSTRAFPVVVFKDKIANECKWLWIANIEFGNTDEGQTTLITSTTNVLYCSL